MILVCKNEVPCELEEMEMEGEEEVILQYWLLKLYDTLGWTNEYRYSE